jgi:hydrogenase maturation protein HypF
VVRKQFRFRGTIQGVGFRPAIYRLATALGLSGFVQNRRSEVLAEVQGDPESVARFASGLLATIPPAAHIDRFDVSEVRVHDTETSFSISQSEADRFAFPPIPPDLPLCPDCAAELLDPRNRRYLYPFITCTQCGPRYSIVERTPFDRENTSMRAFTQCAPCASEYTDPGDRRFHSQTNSCPSCGPRLEALDAAGRPIAGEPMAKAVAALLHGDIVAVQGIGGFHLAADPRSAAAIARLRREKERERKPFALMVRDMEEARALCTLTQKEETLLLSAEAPIVIAPLSPSAPAWLAGVSDTGTLGIMLPYAPLHLLLFQHPDLGIDYRHLVMTSGNRANEPIITEPEAAMEQLAGVASVFLCHERRIVSRVDDSVLRVGSASGQFLIRRSRGYVPRLLALASEVRGSLLGVGGDLKSAPSLARGRDLHLCPFIGDLEDPRTLSQFDGAVRQILELYGVSPDLVVHDMHPLYHSTHWAELQGFPRVAIQHHFAHALSVMAEHGLEETIALCFDGTGYGTDGTIWGGEFLHVTRGSFRRLGSFSPFMLPGGEAAVLHPSRTAFSLLDVRADGSVGSGPPALTLTGIDHGQESLLRAMLEKKVSCPVTTSMGRIFDAAASILGLVDDVSYEGEGPIRLEGRGLRAFVPGRMGVTQDEAAELLPFTAPADADGRLFLIDPRPLLLHLVEERPSAQVPALALLFHEAVAYACVEAADRLRDATRVNRLALSGGVFQNLLLREMLIPLLNNEGFEVFLNEKVPPGDGGLSVGQAWFER